MTASNTMYSIKPFVVISVMLWFAFPGAGCRAQFFPSEEDLLSRLANTQAFPEKLLGTRTAVFHSHAFSEKELITVQDYFQRTGVDAVAYFPTDMLTSGNDVYRAFAALLNKREVTNLAFLRRTESGFSLTVTLFSGKETIVEKGQPAWSAENRLLIDLLKAFSREAIAAQKRTNLLINSFPEMEMSVNPIVGKRNEFFAVDMKVDLVAVPRTGDEKTDRELEEVMTAEFPFKFRMTDPGVPEKDLRKQGFLYVLCFVHSRAEIARQLLGYSTSKAESAVVSVTFPQGVQQLRNIPSNATVYKVYFKHIDSGNIFLGTKWDADTAWQDALKNNIRAMKAEVVRN